METYETILEIMSVLFIIIGIIFKKHTWGKRLLYFGLGMFVTFILTDGVEGFYEGLKSAKP